MHGRGQTSVCPPRSHRLRLGRRGELSILSPVHLPCKNITTNPSFDVQGLTCFRGDRDLFSDLSFQLCPGQALHIQGANGSGKTTLLRTLCGLRDVEAGEVRWQGHQIRFADPSYCAALNYIGHLDGVKQDLTPLENLRFARMTRPAPTDVPLLEVLQRLQIVLFHDVLARTLSAGQRRRIALARLLVSQAALWVLDEPFTALDASGCRVLDGMINEHLHAGGCALLASHQPIEIAGNALQTLSLDG